MYFSVTARHDIILNCFWYDFFMGHLHKNEQLCKVWCEKFMWKNSTWPHLHYTYAFCLLVFVHIYQKHTFVQICTTYKSDTRQNCIFDVICHVIFHIVFAELKLCMVMISVITVEIWCTYMLYSNIVSYWKLSYVEV